MTDSSSLTAQQRWRWYWLLIAATLVWHVVRVSGVVGRDGHTPFLSANDRSRWCAVVALVEHGTFAIDDVIVVPGWNTIDKVKHRGRDNLPHYYSSKPPILSVLLAGPSWGWQTLTGQRLSEHPFLVGRTIIALFNGACLLVLLGSGGLLIERWGTTDWGRIFTFAVLCWGTFLTTFSVTINNHLPAAACVMVATYCLMRIWDEEQASWGLYATAGGCAALAAAFDLPALSLWALFAAAAALRAPLRTAAAYVPASALVAAIFFATNFAAHDSWRPPYAHRAAGQDWEGDNWYRYEGSYWLPENRRGVDIGEPSRWTYAFHTLVGHHGIWTLTPVWLLSIWGTVLWTRRDHGWAFAIAITLLTVTCLAFYIVGRPAGDRNYGGVTCGFRWAFWLIPLFVAAMIPAVDHCARRRGWRSVCYILLLASFASAAYGGWHPWRHPWLYIIWPGTA